MLRMKSNSGRWLALACCTLAAVSAVQDNVLRFHSRKEMMEMDQRTQEQQSGNPVFRGGFQGDQPLEKFRAKDIVCPNGVTQCPDSDTCCPLQNGQYGCCEGVNAVCCKDGVHCCPKGYKCDEQHGQCTSDARGISFNWADRKVLRSRPVLRAGPSNVTCPDKKTVCHLNDTCCPAQKGFGCCPLSRGVCCPDKLHCCPTGTKCDMVHRRCFRGDWEQLWVERRPEGSRGTASSDEARPAMSKKQAVVCKDGLMCPDGDTCCLLASGSYGCCPFSDAVCCSDHVHCCPHDCRCDYIRKGCVGRWHVHRWFHIVHMAGKARQTPLSESVTRVVCPGGQFYCPDKTTCCQLSSGQWGCCPEPNATCCSDHIHCCPQKYTCDVSTGQCKKATDGQSFVPWALKKPATPAGGKVESVVCPDQTQCQDGQTCCPMTGGRYGCCPYPGANCCSDKIHCCPSGYSCNLVSQSCDKSGVSMPWQEKKPAVASVEAVICPGGKLECPSGSTCCLLKSGEYGCCPKPNAVCCEDHLHCCPSGYTCDLKAQSCKKGGDIVAWEEKLPALQRVQAVICPDQSQCPDNSTCCKLTTGQYGCCPYPRAVCCSDHVHCCPESYTCNVPAQTCDKGSSSLPWEEKQPAVRRVQVVVCPDGHSQCPDGSTCCRTTSGQYGCCPRPHAVCCSDGVHCCPEGYTCDTARGTCDKGSYSLPWEEKQPVVGSLP
ncbi:progranulin-like [Babylonia areolata]|uniref:progranulin-like n=1 Tax=Babylonia areolata TaxID=304850 RepID=UPI003FD60603